MASKTLYMSTTQIAPQKTASEITGVLSRAPGIKQIQQEFNGQGKVVAIHFGIEISPEIRRAYRLPINTRPVFEILKSKSRRSKDADIRAQAERTAWRLVLRWVQAQLAMIQTGMVSTPEAFYPYMLVRDAKTGHMRTTFEGFVADQLKALPEAGE
jgi:hypothetical protein